MTKITKCILYPGTHQSTIVEEAAYLEAALWDSDSKGIAAVLEDITRAKGMTQIAREAGVEGKIYTNFYFHRGTLNLTPY